MDDFQANNWWCYPKVEKMDVQEEKKHKASSFLSNEKLK